MFTILNIKYSFQTIKYNIGVVNRNINPIQIPNLTLFPNSLLSITMDGICNCIYTKKYSFEIISIIILMKIYIYSIFIFNSQSKISHLNPFLI